VLDSVKKAAKTDKVLRAMTQDGAFRVMAAVVSVTARDCADVQLAKGELALRLGELLCASILVRETMQPGRRVQLILYDSYGGRLVADSQPDGSTRGIVNPGSEEQIDLENDGRLEVSYTLRDGKLHQGIVGFPAGGDVATALMAYLHNSEQITAFVNVHGMRRGDSLEVGGFVVQVTPEAQRHDVDAIAEHLANMAQLSGLLLESDSPSAMIDAVLEHREYSMLADSEIFFGCTCSQERMMIGLSSLPRTDLADLLSTGQGIEVSCDACGRKYDITTEALAGLLVSSGDSGLKN
jgi:molecular chaperone Hsp33